MAKLKASLGNLMEPCIKTEDKKGLDVEPSDEDLPSVWGPVFNVQCHTHRKVRWLR